ncbi:MAG: tRNA(Met) cytidine acetyltransferase [Chromatiaceae bacterium]|nr:tRNA(Met) cytidine acetyltransferase [Chromatiaceae bacterium]MBP8288767.1 tRNA(Met) cytidine acetyltransferase [Chromatiaceae bacterium]MBP9604766.1 tRNA(Met) cytidine acetyltransferase [Chromatiaceae bacterium]
MALAFQVREWRRLASARRHRLALVIAGAAAWTQGTAEACLRDQPGTGVWLADGPLTRPHQPLAAGLKLLGRELDYLVYDAQAGFDPDSFGAATGALCGGGLLLLLTPPLQDWPDLPDPQARRITVEGCASEHLGGRFVARLTRVLASHEGLTLIEQGKPAWLTAPPPSKSAPAQAPAPACPAPEDPGATYRTPDQAEAVQTILHTARGRARRPLVLISDRGRGKTAALGLAAGQLLAEGMARILVTAPRLAAVAPLFHHAAAQLNLGRMHADRIEIGQGEIRFLPPDALCQGTEPADLLLVDEAAAIPAPLLERLLVTYPRLVFASTIHGYEGTGHGFEVRFRRSLQRLTPNYRRLELKTPIRWAPDDPLEALVARALLLDAAPAAAGDLADAKPDNCRHARLDRDALAGDETSLAQLFGLLVLAHYQTRPLDLRHLLDGPNIQVQILRHRGQIAATALVALEGRFTPDLARDIYEGRRRPRGHLLPQTLSAHAGLEEAPLLDWARILRIAVHPAAQGRGLGRLLVGKIQDQARADHQDLVGVSFGATRDLLRFWEACGLAPVHLGTSRNAASGAQAAVVLGALSATGEALARRARERFSRRLPAQLAGPCRSLEPDLAATLLAMTAPEPPPASDEPDWRELAAFAFAQRPFEASYTSLRALTEGYVGPALRQGDISLGQAIPLIALVLQHRDWGEVARLMGAAGRAEVILRVREVTAALLVAMGKTQGR